MKVVITGVSGFIGTNLKERLLKNEYEVVIVPRDFLYQPAKLEYFLLKEQPNFIYHLAAYGNQPSQKDPYQIARTNLTATTNLLLASRDIDYEGFINFGSSSEYGESDNPMGEEHLLNSNSFYGVTKAGATIFARACAKQWDKPIVTIRPFSVYGGGEAINRFIPIVIKSLMYDEEFKLEPEATHDWIYMSDFLDGVLTVSEKIYELKGQAVNIGTGTMTTNLEVVTTLENIYKKKARFIEVTGIRPDHSLIWVADNTKLKQLGWKQKHTLEQGLKETSESYKVIFGNYCL
jgi:nucleoside-diphosphate-sugar epimerase